MGYKCCVPECRSGYASAESKNTDASVAADKPVKISMFAFPIEISQRKKWLAAIKRINVDNQGKAKEYIPTEHSRVCQIHFKNTDFVSESCDTNT